MRRAALGLLVASAGCNQIFGLDATTSLPDAPDVIPPDAMWSSIQLGFLHLTFDPASTTPLPVIAPFPDLATVSVASLDGALVPRPVDAMGLVTIPLDITTAGPFRLVYQRSGDPVVREYQGLVPDARVIEPLWGPITRPPVPAGAGYVITPMGAPSNHALNSVFTVGTWTETRSTGGGMPSFNLAYGSPSTVSMSGPLGLPAATDAGVLVDYDATVQPCERATGSSRFPAANAAAHPAVSGDIWSVDNVTRQATTDGNLEFPPAIKPFLDESALTHRENYGFVPSAAMPSFTRPPAAGLAPAFLRNPVMMIMRTCSALDVGMAAHRPTLFRDKLVEAIYTETTVERIVSGVLLTNGLGVLTLISTPQTIISVATDVAVASTAVLKSTGGDTPLFAANSVDQLPLSPATGARTLSWEWAGNIGRADFWEVRLMEMTSPIATLRRIYTTTNVTKTTGKTTTTVRIDPADLAPNKHYVFQISAFIGRPDAAGGNFSRVVGNQATSVVHTHSFITPP